MKMLISSITCIVIVSCFSCRQVKEHPRVLMRTEVGDMVIEVYEDRAPVTAGNFLRYVDENRFVGAAFYRVFTMDNQPDNDVKIEVIQGGLWKPETVEESQRYCWGQISTLDILLNKAIEGC